ncbi:MAG: peptidase C1 [Gammaproteobacteria bacterium]|nr:peptidase C1 [Gammaproteobacteria bacterium]
MATKDKKPSDRFDLAVRADAPDFRDFIYSPPLITLKPRLAVPRNLNIRDQGQEGACTGFGLAAVIDRQVNETRVAGKGKPVSVSVRMLYEMARRYDEWEGEDYEGSSCRGAIKGWYNMGVCREELYPYQGRKQRTYSVAAAKDARNCTVGAYFRLGKRISDYHAALNETGAIFCSADVHVGWDAPDKTSGLIEFDAKAETEYVGGHAFAIVGYDSRGFWIQNSWGRRWGKSGTALWTYEDWQLSVMDAWVFRLALPTPQIWHLPARNRGNPQEADASITPTRAEIAGHFVHIDDGCFQDKGRYWSNLNDVQQTAELVATSGKYQHLLFYAHGGLNSPEASARRISAMKQTFKANGIYPFHLMYDTGILEELKDVIFGRKQQAEARAGGLPDWIDTLVERATRVPGRALWREMKAGARLPFAETGAGTASIKAFMDAFARHGATLKVHLVGHSTGMILLSHLLARLGVVAPTLEVDTVSLMAPAGTVDLFTSHLQPLIKATKPAFRVKDMAIYNLSEALELDDTVSAAYHKSLLYLVSRSFEESIPEQIIGMKKFSQTVERRQGLGRLKIYYSEGPGAPGKRVTESETHGGFDNDPATMNHILERILPADSVKPFTAATLKY